MPNSLGSEFKAVLAECLRPWKLTTLALGLGLLVVGSFYFKAPDWDIPISFIMAILAYLTASWSLRIILERRWKRWPLMMLLTWFTVDGCYWLYWNFKDPVALQLMRGANAPASLGLYGLYGLCGLVWLHRGNARSLAMEIRDGIVEIASRGSRKSEGDTSRSLEGLKTTTIAGKLAILLVSLLVLAGLLIWYVFLYQETFNKPAPGSNFGSKHY